MMGMMMMVTKGVYEEKNCPLNITNSASTLSLQSSATFTDHCTHFALDCEDGSLHGNEIPPKIVLFVFC